MLTQEFVIYEEKVSGKSMNKRVELRRMLSELEKADTVIVSEISRLARSTIDLWNIANEILNKGCVLICVKENFDLSTAMGRFTFNIFGSIAQLERETISERTKDGLAAKKASGVILGRPITLNQDNIEKAIDEYMNGRESKLTRIILSDEKKRKILFNKIISGESIVGTVFEVSGKKYKITTGDLNDIDTKISVLKNRLLDKYCHK